ncbi:hypothetical protein M427DRAFT_135031 [Gonapodya prolifera JEL478]|uniref:DUF1212-domain-containing protein n=1 Tax=Gonapodya prolifera (strain JEL478) TaxID=1344416 RepID=A0A139AFH4_GONPJ|nr:hypothetical protein M427DRAFT_135031 [Gonapodya prolifera JEL478]|eukprot:KXS15556.1 hypothetical protein M427DRAFT_135031 [Gonapodya prolifera JEL478]
MCSSRATSLDGYGDEIVTSPLLSGRQSGPATPSVSVDMAESTNHKKRDILIRLTKALITYGSPTYRLEKYMKSVAAALDLERTQFVILHQTLFTGFPVAVPIVGGSSTEIESTSFSPLLEEWNMEKLESVTELINDLKNGDVSPDSAEGRLNVIDGCRSTFSSTLANLVAFPLQAGVSSVLFFGGNWLSFALTVVVGLFAGVMQCLPSLANLRVRKNNARPLSFLASSDLSVLQSFLAAAVSSFVARILSYKFATDQFRQCFGTLLMGSVVFLLPGVDLVEGAMDVATGNSISGVAKWGNAVVQTILIGFGIHLGQGIAFWIPRDTEVMCNHPVINQDDFWQDLTGGGIGKLLLISSTTLLLAVCFCILLKCSLKQTPICILAVVVAWVVNGVVGTSSGFEMSSFAASFAVELLSNIYAKAFNRSSTPPTLCGVFVIVPGALGLQGVLSLWKDAPGNGGQVSNSGEFAGQVVKVTMGILVGILLSHLIVFAPSPRGRRKSLAEVPAHFRG